MAASLPEPTLLEKLDLILAFFSICELSQTNRPTTDLSNSGFSHLSRYHSTFSWRSRSRYIPSSHHSCSCSQGEASAYDRCWKTQKLTNPQCTTRMSTTQLQYLNPSFLQVYEKWCKEKGFQPNVVTLDSGVKAMWVGETTAKTIVIYYHGTPRMLLTLRFCTTDEM